MKGEDECCGRENTMVMDAWKEIGVMSRLPKRVVRNSWVWRGIARRGALPGNEHRPRGATARDLPLVCIERMFETA